MSYNYQDQPMESQSEWLGEKTSELNKKMEHARLIEWCMNLEKRIKKLEHHHETQISQTEEIINENQKVRFKVNGFLHGKEVWIFTDSLRIAQKVQLDAECNEIHSVIYEWTPGCYDWVKTMSIR